MRRRETSRQLPRGDQGRRRRRRRHERRQPHGRRRPRRASSSSRVNTDAQALLMCDADVKIHIGAQATRGLGAGADPDVGRGRGRGEPRRAEGGAQGRRHGLRHRGRGRRHRHRRRAVVAELARELERADRRRRHAAVLVRGRSARRARPSAASRSSRERVDTLIVIENDRLLQVVEKQTSIVDAFRMADDVLRQGVQGITDLITVPGLVNLDFADVRTIMRDAGSALMGIGIASGENRAGRGRARRGLVAAARGVDRGRDRHPAQHHRPGRPRPVRGQRGGRGRHERRRPERQRHLRRRHRRHARRRGARHRDRDGLRRASARGGDRRGAPGRRRRTRAARAESFDPRRRRARSPVVPARRRLRHVSAGAASDSSVPRRSVRDDSDATLGTAPCAAPLRDARCRR